jgi:hypothetical protein
MMPWWFYVLVGSMPAVALILFAIVQWDKRRRGE